MIGPLGLESRLLERGFVVARFENDWEALGEVARARGAQRDDAAEGESEAEPDRVGAWLLAAPRPGILGRDYLGLVHATAKTSVPAVLELLAGLPEVDPERIAVAGSSTHGFQALEALALHRQLAAGVVRVACGDYHTFLRASSLGADDDPRWLENGDLVLDADYDAALREREAFRHPDRYPPRPLLMLNGGQDPAIPLACADRTARALRRAYREAGVPERFRFEVFEDAGHDLGPEADRVVLDWLERWLTPRIPSGPAPTSGSSASRSAPNAPLP